MIPGLHVFADEVLDEPGIEAWAEAGCAALLARLSAEDVMDDWDVRRAAAALESGSHGP